jgi:hypothetical protein
MSKREALTAQRRRSAMHHAHGRTHPNQDLVAGALTANAPPPQGRTRRDALVTLAGYARQRREIWRNPSRLGEGVALQMVRNGTQQKCGCSALREASTAEGETYVLTIIGSL